MTTIHSNITTANYDEVVAATEQARARAAESHDRLKAIFEGRTAPKTDYDDDPAIVSGIRRKSSGSRRQREDRKMELDLEAYAAYQQAATQLKTLDGRLARLKKSAPVLYTEAELRAADLVRTDDGWFELLKVNAKTVGVDAGFPWPHKISRDRVLEVRKRDASVKPSSEQETTES